MAKLTWLGTEDYREGETPLESITWCGRLFTAGDKVEVTDEWMIAKARGNRFFRVEDAAPAVPAQAGIEPTGAKSPATQWREPDTEADPADVSFFDDPPGVAELASWQLTPSNEAVIPPPLDYPPDYPPEEEPKRKRGRPRKVIANDSQ